MKKVFMLGYDITQFIIEISSIPISKADIGQLSISENIKIKADNKSNFWNIKSKYSPLYSKHLENIKIEIYDDEKLIVNANILDISINNDYADVTLKNEINTIMDTICIYISEIVSPAEITEKLLIHYGFKCDNASFSMSKKIHEYNGVKVCITLNGVNTDMSVLNVIQQLANIGVARIYFCNNKFYYEAYNNISENMSEIYIEKKNIIKTIEIKSINNKEYDKYQIVTVSGTYTGGNTNSINPIKTLDYSISNPIKIYSGAHYIGESYLNISKNNKYNISFAVSKNIGNIISLNTKIRIINNKSDSLNSIEIMNIDNSNKLYTQISGVSQ